MTQKMSYTMCSLACGINISAVQFDVIVVDSNKTFQYIEETGNGNTVVGAIVFNSREPMMFVMPR